MSGAHSTGRRVEEVAAGDSRVHRLDVRVKILALTGLAAVSATTPEGRWWAFAAYLALLAALAAVARLPLRYVAGRMTVELPFLLAAAVLVLVADDGPRVGATLALKITVGVLAIVVLSSTTPFPLLLRGLERLRAPRVVLMIVSFMWRSLHVFVDDLRRARLARTARGYDPRWLWQTRPIAQSMATQFVRSVERGERVYLAMLARGYSGGVPATVTAPLTLRGVDVATGLALAAAVAGARVAA